MSPCGDYSRQRNEAAVFSSTEAGLGSLGQVGAGSVTFVCSQWTSRQREGASS